jgi:hypothetical protein
MQPGKIVRDAASERKRRKKRKGMQRWRRRLVRPEKAARIGARRSRRNLAQLNARMLLKRLSSLMSSYVVTLFILKFGMEIYGLERAVVDRA